jgi:hypothetical protein
MKHSNKTLLLLLTMLLSWSWLSAQTARLQVIHNAPEPTVDIYVNGALLLNDFTFRSATPFIDVPANVVLSIAVAPGTSTSVSDAIATFPVTLNDGGTYVVIAAGVVGNTGATAFNLFINGNARETATTAGNVDVAVFHGGPDAPAIDADAVFLADNVVSNLSFGQYTGYLDLPAAKYDLALQPAGTNNTVASFRADLSGLAGGAATVFASGFLAGTPSFGLFAALPNGTVIALPLTPTARVQIIHNSPDPSVDVYVGNTRLIDDFAFRTATPFIDVPADRDLNIGIALPNSMAASEAIANFPVNLTTDSKYVVTAAGVVGNTGATAFNLFINGNARETAATAGNVAVAVFHGGPDAPAIDADAVFLADNVVSNLSFGQYTGYLDLPAAKYDLALQPAGTNNTVASFRADLSGLAGGAATVFASGFLAGTPSFGLFAALPNGTVIALPLTPTARVQIIHNSPDPSVDVYVGNTRLIDNFAFRTATPFIDVPADRDLNIGIALPNSMTASEAIANFPVNLTTGSKYVVTAAGVVGNTGATAFNLFINGNARETATTAGNVAVAVFHGGPDAPAIDADAVFLADNVVSNLSFGQYTGYLDLPAAKYDLALQPAGTNNTVASFRADLSGLAGGAATVFASGFLAGTPSFGLFAALPNGTVVALPLTPTARVQIIHNSPDPTVDVYVGNTRLIDNFAFRTATPFIDVPADRDLNIGIALPNSMAASEAIANFPVNLTTGSKYVVTAAGVVGNTGATAFNLFINGNARETAATAGNVAVAVFHGGPDAPAIDADAVFLADNVVSNLSFGQYTGYLDLPAAKYDLALQPAGTNNTVASFRADLSGLAGGAATVFASGFLAGTPSFGLFAALPNGTVIALPLTPTARVQIIHNSPDPTVDVYVGNTRLIDNFAFRTATPFIDVPADRDLNIGIALPNSMTAADAIANFPVNLATGGKYVVTAAGVVGNTGATAFNLFINGNARETAATAGNVAVAVFHGGPDAPAIDADAVFLADNVVSNLSFGQYTGYLDLPAAKYDLALQPAGTNNTVASFRADLSGLAGGAATVFASGFLAGTPSFGLFAALPNGTVVALPLTPTSRVQIIHNSPDPTVDVYVGNTRLIDDFAFRTATPFIDVPADRDLNIGIALPNSMTAADAIANFPVNLATGGKYVVTAAGVVGNTGATAFNLFINGNAREAATNAGNVDISLFHGSPDAPEVDVTLPGGPILFDNVSFGEYGDYFSAPAGNYTINVTPGNDNNTVVAAYKADVTTLAGQAMTAFATGFLGGQTPAFGVWVALANGVTFPLEISVSTKDIEKTIAGLVLMPNPAVEAVNISFELMRNTNVAYRLLDNTGRVALSGDFGQVSVGNFNENIQLNGLSSGVYHLQLITAEGFKTTRLVVGK